MPLSDALAAMSAQAKEVEDRFHAAQSEQRAKLQQDLSRARATAEERNTELRLRGDQTKAQVSSWWRDLQLQWDKQMQQIRSNIEAKREEHDVKRAAADADAAEADAEFAISMARAAIDEAEYACLEAVLARDKANDLASGS